MVQTQGEDPIDDLGRRGQGVRVVRGRQVFQPSETVRRKSSLPLVETVEIHPLPTIRFQDIPQRFGELQNRQTLMSQLLMRPFGRDTRHTHDTQ